MKPTLIKYGDNVLNLGHLVRAEFHRHDRPPFVALFLADGTQKRVQGDEAVRLFAHLCQLCEAAFGPDHGLYLAADLAVPDRAEAPAERREEL